MNNSGRHKGTEAEGTKAEVRMKNVSNNFLFAPTSFSGPNSDHYVPTVFVPIFYHFVPLCLCHFVPE